MIIKPRLKQQGVFWLCYGGGSFARGFTMQDAYANWLAWSYPAQGLKVIAKAFVKKEINRRAEIDWKA